VKFTKAEKILSPLTLDGRYLFRTSYMLSDIMERQGKYSSAIEYLTKIVKAAKDYKIAAKLGDLYWKTGDRRSAMRYYIAASDMGDGLSSVKAGDCLYMFKDYARAKTYYKRAIDYAVKDTKSLQWAQYQYGKLAKNRDYLKKAATGGGEIAEAAAIILEGK
jgi:tetratricopeptide (TPR) repeat protein